MNPNVNLDINPIDGYESYLKEYNLGKRHFNIQEKPKIENYSSKLGRTMHEILEK